MSERLIPQEQIPTPEKSAERFYLDALEKKRDTLLAFHTMTSFRKGRSPEDMDSEEIKKYEVLREEWRSKKEISMSAWDILPEDKQQELAAMGSRLYDVQAQLTLLKPKEVPEPETGETIAEVPATEKTTLEQATEEASETKTEETEKTTLEQPEKPESALSLSEVEDYVSRLEKSSPQPLLAIEAWKAKRAELQERQEAEANPDQMPPKGFMQRVRDAFDKAKESIVGANRISGGSETVEDRMSPLGLRKEALSDIQRKIAEKEKQSEPISAEPTPVTEEVAEIKSEIVQSESEPQKATAWSFLKERARGLITPFGFREFRQAEILRRRTGEISNDTEALAILIQKERNLNLEEAEKEAQEIVNVLKEQGLTISAPEFYEISKNITDRKKRENDDEIVYIVKSAEDDIYDKLQKARGEAGQDILTRENQLAIRADLMSELNKLRDGEFGKDLSNYAKLIRRNLDRKWGWRYVWGGLDAALWFLGVASISMKFLASKEAAAVGAKVAAGGAGSAEAAREFVETGMHKNVWSTLEQMAKNGPGHITPTAEQLKEWSQATLDAIQHYEPEWMEQMIEGLKSSRTMPEGFPLKVPAEVMKAMGY